MKMAALFILRHVNLMSYIRINSLKDSLFSVERMNEFRGRKSRVLYEAVPGTHLGEQIHFLSIPRHVAVLGQVFIPLAFPGTHRSHMHVKHP